MDGLKGDGDVCLRRWIASSTRLYFMLYQPVSCTTCCEERKECYLEEWNRLGEDEIGDLPRPDLLNDDDADDTANIIRNALARCLYN